MPLDLTKFKATLPYASELYGIYQPLLGWRSKRTQGRIADGMDLVRVRFLDRICQRFLPRFSLNELDHPEEVRFTIDLAATSESLGKSPTLVDSIVVRRIASLVGGEGGRGAEAWEKLT